MTHTPNNQPDPLEKLLGALNAAEPPSGMELRILQTVQLHATPTAPAHFSWPRLAFGLPLLVIAGVALHGFDHAFSPAILPANATSLLPLTCISPQTASCARPAPGPNPLASTLAPVPVRMLTSMQPKPDTATRFAEVGLPAQAMPLTEQERLLLRVALNFNRGHPDRLIPDLQTSLEASKQSPDQLPHQTPDILQDPLQFSSFLEPQVSRQIAAPLSLIASDLPAPVWPPLPPTFPEMP